MNKLNATAAFAVICLVLSNAPYDRPAAGQPKPAASQGPAAGTRLSLSLAQALALAQSNNLTYRSAVADEKIARAKVIQAGAGRNPSIAANYQYIHTQSAGFFAFPAPGPSPKITVFPTSSTSINNLNATLRYAVYTGGAVQAAIGEAAAGLSAAESDLDAARADVIRDTIAAYFGLMSALQVATIDARAVQVAQQDLEVSEQQYNAGTLAKADVLRGQVSVENARVQSIQADAAAALANAKLALTQSGRWLADGAWTVLGSRLAADAGEGGTYSWARLVLGVPGMRIAGGSDEIMRNILGERVLGLPKEPPGPTGR